jgi:hypothetical protein
LTRYPEGALSRACASKVSCAYPSRPSPWWLPPSSRHTSTLVSTNARSGLVDLSPCFQRTIELHGPVEVWEYAAGRHKYSARCPGTRPYTRDVNVADSIIGIYHKLVTNSSTIISIISISTVSGHPAFALAGKMGWAIPFDGESFAGGKGGARLPARAEFGSAARIGSTAGEHRLPHLRAYCKFHDIGSSGFRASRLWAEGECAVKGLSITPAGGEDAPVMPSSAAVDEAGAFALKKIASASNDLTLPHGPAGAYLKSVLWNGREKLGESFDFSAGAAGDLQVILGTGGAASGGSRPARHAALKDVPPGNHLLFAWEKVEEGDWFDPAIVKAAANDGVMEGQSAPGSQGGPPTVPRRAIGPTIAGSQDRAECGALFPVRRWPPAAGRESAPERRPD